MNRVIIPSISLKKTALFFALIFGLASLTACSPTEKNSPKHAEPAASTTTATSATTTTVANALSPAVTGNKPVIYASTTMWGAVAKAVGGDQVEVVTAIDSPNQDPHDYQASAKDKLAMQNANAVVVNGGGYDGWASSLVTSLANKPVLINAFDLLDKNIAHTSSTSEANEHVFYSLDTAQKVAQAIATQLAISDPTNKASYLQNAQAFADKITCLKTKAHSISAANKTAVATESVSDYLLVDMGIKNITPPAYVAQSETEAGVSAKVLLDTKNLLSHKAASLLVLNAQTEDNTAKQLSDSANIAGVNIVEVYETLPADATDYIHYMNDTINRFNTAVNGVNPKPLPECQ